VRVAGGVQRVVPFSVPVVASDGKGLHLLVGDLDTDGVAAESAVTLSPVVVLVAPMRLMIVSWLASGLPCQFLVIWENSGCSIFLHLTVPGGGWDTVMSRPVSAARAASSVFHVRRRLPLAPPELAVINRRVVSGLFAVRGEGVALR